MNIKEIPIDEIKEYEDNPRVNDRTIIALVKSIRKFGFNQPIVVDKDYVIIKGHSRYKACKELGLSSIPCIVSENTDEQNQADRVMDNRIHDLTRWNHDLLRMEMRDTEDAINEILGRKETYNDYVPTVAVENVTEKAVDKAFTELEDKGKVNERYYKIPCKCGYNLYLNTNVLK